MSRSCLAAPPCLLAFGSLRLLAIAFWLLALFSPPVNAWDGIRSLGGNSSGAVDLAVSSYTVTYVVGEPAAALNNLVYSSGAVLSGYLSQIPSSTTVNPVLSAMAAGGGAGPAAGGAVFAYGSLWGAGPAEPVRLVFSNELSTSIISSQITVTEVTDNLESPVNSTRAVSLAYDPSGKFLSLDPGSAGWRKGSLYAVHYTSDSMKDINGLPVMGPATAYFTAIFDRAVANREAPPLESGAGVAIPADTYADDFFMLLSTGRDSAAVQAADRKAEAMPGVATRPVKVLTAASFDQSGNPARPAAKQTISLSYRDDDNNGIVDGTSPPAPARNLSIWRLDEAKNTWVKQLGASIDASAKKVSLAVPGFSSYGLMALPDADVSAVYAYPVPFRPNAANPARYGTWQGQITFTNLPSYGAVRIYTITGALVREIAITTPPEMKWDIRNSGGEIVASGVYLWEVVCGGNRKTGKLMVVK